jgi:hypothetical protein
MTASSRCLLFPRPCDPFNFGEVKVTTRQQFRPCVPFDPPIRPDLIPFPQLRGELGQSARRRRRRRLFRRAGHNSYLGCRLRCDICPA